ncbi:MAG: MiaB/RimO family radical SAM methylthiotransferase [Candidatus Omnitrophota bacterium]
MKTVKFYTLGCKVNQYDTQNLRERFEEAGFREGEEGRQVDVCVVNTCTVTHRADANSLNIIRRARRLNPKAEIIVTGCLAKFDKHRILDAAKGLLFLKRSSWPQHSGISYFKGHTRAFLKIQDGCSNLCSYCKVPLVRGASRSRPLEDIVQETGRLVAGGYKEIVLCGICLGAYGKDLKTKIGLAQVIEALEEKEGLAFIRLSSIELNDITVSLTSLLRRSRKLCPHLHIPLQSGDDTILEKMNRRYTAGHFLDKVMKIKKEVPGIAITTDVLVGFPTETEEHFKNTLRVIRKISPLKVHVFPYSHREGTKAFSAFGARIEADMMRRRIAQMRALAQERSRTYRMSFVNKTLDVLIERRWKQDPDFWMGRTPNYMEVLVKSRLDIEKRLVRLKLKKGPAPFFLAGDFY